MGRVLVSTVALAASLLAAVPSWSENQGDSGGKCASVQSHAESPLASWNDGPAKQAIISFVHRTTDPGSPDLVPPTERIATFDQDGTLWVEHPMFVQVLYSLDRVRELAKERPQLASTEPFKTVLSGDRAAIAALSKKDVETIVAATMIGLDVDAYQAQVSAWLAAARDPRFQQSYLDLVYLPMLEVMAYLREHGYKTYIVTGGGQDFVRAYSLQAYGVPPGQVVGSALKTEFVSDGKTPPRLVSGQQIILNNDFAGKPVGIHLVVGARPRAAFGNSSGDQQMLEYAGGGSGPRLMMLVLHDDPIREYAYGPARGLPDTNVGRFTSDLDNEAQQKGWLVISMKSDWRKLFCFETNPK